MQAHDWAVLVAEPKPSANLVAELTSATFCRSPPAAGSGRTYGCLFGKHPKSCCKQQGRQHRAPQVLAQWF